MDPTPLAGGIDSSLNFPQPNIPPSNPGPYPCSKKGRNTRANIKIASLNINGRSAPDAPRRPSKWNTIHSLMRDERIGVLAIQESHLQQSDIEYIHRLYGRRLLVLNSADPSSHNARGVAFVMNRELVDISNPVFSELHPGRAALLTFHWHNNTTLTLLNVYAPNSPHDNASFWTSLRLSLDSPNIQCPDAVLGDFNLVVDSLDRFPAKSDNPVAVNALLDLVDKLRLADGWRASEPDRADYTYPQRSSSTFSRLDRIYVTDELLRSSSSWEIKCTVVPSDHKLVLARLSAPRAPFIGRGRWALPLHLVSDDVFLDQVMSLGSQALQKAKSITDQPDSRSSTNNPQIIYHTLKSDVRTLAQRLLKERTPRLRNTIDKLLRQIDKLQSKPVNEMTTAIVDEIAFAQDRLRSLLKTQLNETRSISMAKYISNGERISKYWSKVNKEYKPRDVLYSMRVPASSPPLYETRSDRMAELASQYFDSQQQTGPPNSDENTRREEMEISLRSCDKTIDHWDATFLDGPISSDEINNVIRDAPTGKATGPDGLPYELWKHLRTLYEDRKDSGAQVFNYTEMLALVTADIDSYGIQPDGHFNDGWICPLYKKNDRRDISNYRPITLLNCDYKIYSKAIAVRLSTVVPQIIHDSQAAFLPGRHIENQTQLCRVMTDYCEATESNGVLISLDQEKAYDRIKHDYLWTTLARFHIPRSLIKRIKRLYECARTTVIINGEISPSFLVTRGVRQGDPLSCILFILAIEPLSCMLRNSHLKGFTIPGAPERIITNLFADDTSTFLAFSDRWPDLWQLLHTWCRSSGAVFNHHKTKVIPLGTQAYRDAVRQHRSISGSPHDSRIEDNILIARDDEPSRILGAWIGSSIDEASVWSPVLSKIAHFLKRWGKCHPSFIGKRNIVQMGPGGISQYLTRVQGMPKHVEDRIEQMIRSFMWDSTKVPPVSLTTLCQPIAEGGINLLDIRARNEAIELMWIKSYLDLSPQRPSWTYAVDTLISLSVTRAAGRIRSSAQINTFLQSWDPSTSHASPLPTYLKRMLTVAKKHNVSFEAVKLHHSLKQALPIWYHLGALRRMRLLENTPRGDCLRDVHHVRLVSDLTALIRAHEDHQTATPPRTRPCTCTECQNAQEAGCSNPISCFALAHRLSQAIRPKWHLDTTSPADNLSLTPTRKATQKEAVSTDGTVLFDPSLTERGSVSEAFRAFTNPSIRDFPPAIRPRRGLIVHAESSTVFVASLARAYPSLATDANGSRSLACVYFGPLNPKNRCITQPCQGRLNDDLSCECLGLLYAARSVPNDAPITFVLATACSITALSLSLPQWEDDGWIGIPSAPIVHALINVLRQRCAPTSFRKASSTGDWSLIDAARRLALDRAPACSQIDLALARNPAFDLTGARLATLTQRTATRGIRMSQAHPPRRSTLDRVNLVLTYAGLGGINRLTEAKLWHSLRHRDIRVQIHTFLWKVMHNAFRCGDFWSRIPGFENRALCTFCGTTDSIDHILTECRAPGQREVWSLAAQAWTMKDLPWEHPSLPLILSVGCRTWRHPSNRRILHGATRFWRILISESAFIIWRLRCERVIQHADVATWKHSPSQISALWRHALQRRLQIDLLRCSHRKSLPPVPSERVLLTWHRVLEDERGLHHEGDWTRANRVLVGISSSLFLDNG